MRKELENLTIIYNNVRGFKSKVDSIEAILQELGPTIFCAVETHLDKKEDVKIEGYEVKRLDGTANSGGILVAIKDTIKTVVVEIIDNTEVGQMKWLKITNTTSYNDTRGYICTTGKSNPKQRIEANVRGN